MAETVIAWQLLRHAEIAQRRLDDRPGDGFHSGKVASARFFVSHAAPKAVARREAIQAEDGALMASRHGLVTARLPSDQ